MKGRPERRSNLFGGEGSVLVWDLLGPLRLPPFTAVLACELEQGASVGAHRQELYAELVIVTDGEGTATVDGVPHELAPGAVVALPLGSVLTIANGLADQPLRYLIVKGDAGGGTISPPHPRPR